MALRFIRSLVGKVVGQRNLGRLDYFRYPDPSLKYGWVGPFNGQRFRQRIFSDLFYCFPIKAIVETGTWCGTTTAFFGATSLPVYSTEVHPRFYSYARMRFLFNRSNIRLRESDSRRFLKGLVEDNSMPKDDVFFYLDAHWWTDLPLAEELEIIFSGWTNPIVMIDDFQVPGTDYKYDDYGPGKALTLSYIDQVVSKHNLSVFFPAVPPSNETGARSGCVVLCRERAGAEVDRNVNTLVRSTANRESFEPVAAGA